MKEFKEEIRKLKAMIVKHENRIRTLEARATENITDKVTEYGDSLVIKNNDIESNDNDSEHADANDDD